TTVLYAANFRSGKIEVYDPNFKLVTLPAGAFSDPKLPKGFAPFNVQVLGDKVYVTYAQQDAARHDDVAGQGHGFVDVFNLDGTPGLPGGKERLGARGRLDSPWGLALAPGSFGNFAGDLLVGNFGNGFINVFDPTTGKFLGQLKDPDGQPIQIDGLWALKVGNGGAGGDANTVYFTAGLDHEQHGLFGSLAAVAPGTPEGPAEAQAGQGPPGGVQPEPAPLPQDLATRGARAHPAPGDPGPQLVPGRAGASRGPLRGRRPRRHVPRRGPPGGLVRRGGAWLGPGGRGRPVCRPRDGLGLRPGRSSRRGGG